MAMASVKSDSGFVENWQSRKSLAECNLHMLTSEDSCDVTFRVGKCQKVVRAHRYVLISRSCVFHAMLCGPLAEKKDITITDVEVDIFTEMLRFLYTNESNPTPENVTGLFYLAKKYSVGGLEHLCLTYLESSLSAQNACVILEQAQFFEEKQLFDRALKVILENGEECFNSEGFKQMGRECFDKVISSDELTVRAETVYGAAILWMEECCKRQGREMTAANLRTELGQTLYSIPFADMDPKHYVDEVLPRQILTNEENLLLMAHLIHPEKDPSPFRKRVQKNVKDSSSSPHPCMLKSTDVILCKEHCRDSEMDYYLNRTVQFICDQDVVLLGIYVYGSASAHDKYKLKVGVVNAGAFQVNTGNQSTLSPRFQPYHIKTVYLTEPVTIRKNQKHYVTVSKVEGGIPEYAGVGILNEVKVNKGIFTEIRNSRSLNVIYGLILRAE